MHLQKLNMRFEDKLNTIAKIVVILSDIMQKETDINSYIRRLVVCFEFNFENLCNNKTQFNCTTSIDNFNPLRDLEYSYDSDFVEIRTKQLKEVFLSMPTTNVKDFLPFLKKECSELYDIVWLNWSNPEYDILFDWH